MKPSEVPMDAHHTMVAAFRARAAEYGHDIDDYDADRLLDAVLPAHERRVRERVAEQIEARRCGDVAADVCATCSCRREDAQTARGDS